MKSCEAFIAPSSDYFNYMPSISAKNAFFYPICTGLFIYEPGYCLHRNSYDSFLLLYIKSGELSVDFEQRSTVATGGDFLLLDCYQPHGYRTTKGCECLWCHFDGPVAKPHYDLIVSRLGNIFSLPDPQPVLNKLQRIYNTFAAGETIREAALSKHLTDILTGILLYSPMPSDGSKQHGTLRSNTFLKSNNTSKSNEGSQHDNFTGYGNSMDYSSTMEEIVSYINEHFAEDLSIDHLAELAMLSPYHFIRMFKRETGYTPHEYLIHTRISIAKYLLKTTGLPIKDICFHTGFSGESVFCSSFKKNVGCSPAKFRASVD